MIRPSWASRVLILMLIFFSTRDDPALFDVSDDLIVIYEGSPTFDQEGGMYMCQVKSLYYLNKVNMTELYVTIAGHEEIVIPKNTYTIERENTGEAAEVSHDAEAFEVQDIITIFGELDWGTSESGEPLDPYPIFTNYPIVIDSTYDDGFLLLAVPEPITSVIIKAHASELDSPLVPVPNGVPFNPTPGGEVFVEG